MTFSIPVPIRSNYKVAPVDPTVRTDMEFGAARMRRRSSARLDTVSVEWAFSASEMVEFRDWYDTSGSAVWFDMPLNVGEGIETRSARFVQPWEAVPYGQGWLVTGSLEVR